jgi:hypothetical protein
MSIIDYTSAENFQRGFCRSLNENVAFKAIIEYLSDKS